MVVFIYLLSIRNVISLVKKQIYLFERQSEEERECVILHMPSPARVTQG